MNTIERFPLKSKIEGDIKLLSKMKEDKEIIKKLKEMIKDIRDIRKDKIRDGEKIEDEKIDLLMKSLYNASSHKDHYKCYMNILKELLRLFPNIKATVIKNDYMLVLALDNIPKFNNFEEKIHYYNKITNNFSYLELFTLDKLLRTHYFLFKEILLERGNNDKTVMDTIKNFLVVFKAINSKIIKITQTQRDNTQIFLDLQTVKDGLMEAIIMRSIKFMSLSSTLIRYDDYVSSFRVMVDDYFSNVMIEACKFNKNVNKEILIFYCYYLSLAKNKDAQEIFEEIMEFTINLINKDLKNWNNVINSIFTDLNRLLAKDTFIYSTKEIDKFMSIYSHYDNYNEGGKKIKYNDLNSINLAYDVNKTTNAFKGLMLLINEMIRTRRITEDTLVQCDSINCIYEKPTHKKPKNKELFGFKIGFSSFNFLTLIYNICIGSHSFKLKSDCLFNHEILMMTAKCLNCKDVFFDVWDYHLILKIVHSIMKNTKLLNDDISNISLILKQIYYEINESYIDDTLFISILTSILNEFISNGYSLNKQIIKLKLYLTFVFHSKDFAYDVDFCIKYFIVDGVSDYEMVLLFINYLIYCYELQNEFKCKVIEDLIVKYYNRIINVIYQINEKNKEYTIYRHLTEIIFDVAKGIKDEKKFEELIQQIGIFSKNLFLRGYQVKIFYLFLVYFNDIKEANKMRIVINVLFPNSPSLEFHGLNSELLSYFYVLDSKFIIFTRKKGKKTKQSEFPCLIAKTNEKEQFNDKNYVVIDYNNIMKKFISQKKEENKKKKEEKTKGHMTKILKRSIKQVYPFSADTLNDAINYYIDPLNKNNPSTVESFLVNCVYLLNFKSDLYLNEISSQSNESIIPINNNIKDELLNIINRISSPSLFCFYINSTYDEEIINEHKSYLKEDSKVQNKIRELLRKKKEIVTKAKGNISIKEKYEIIFTIFNLREIIALCSSKVILDALYLSFSIILNFDTLKCSFYFNFVEREEKRKEGNIKIPKNKNEENYDHPISHNISPPDKSPFLGCFVDTLICYLFNAYVNRFSVDKKEMKALFMLYKQRLPSLYSNNQEKRKSLLLEIYYFIFMLRDSNRTNLEQLPKINKDYVKQSSIYKKENEIILIHHINENEGELILTTPVSLYYYRVNNIDNFSFDSKKQLKKLKHILDKGIIDEKEEENNIIKKDNNDNINPLMTSDGAILKLFETYEGSSNMFLWRKEKLDDNMITCFIDLIQMPINITYTINIAYSSSHDGNIDNFFSNINQYIPNYYINFISRLGKVNDNKQIIYKDNFYTLIFNIVNISNSNENVRDLLLSSSKVIYLLDTHLLVKSEFTLSQINKDVLLHFVSRVSDSHYLIQRRTFIKEEVKEKKTTQEKQKDKKDEEISPISYLNLISSNFANDYLININAKSSIRYFIKSIIAYSEFFLYNKSNPSKNDLYLRKEKFEELYPKEENDGIIIV